MGNVLDAIKKTTDPAAGMALEQLPVTHVAGQYVAAPKGIVPGKTCYSEMLAVHHNPGGEIAEQFRALRTHLLARYHDERFCLMITSAEGGEGKTITCLNLALALTAREAARTLVVDCDLRKGRIASLLGMKATAGLGDFLAGRATRDEAVCPTAYPNLFILPSGPGRQNPGELVGRPELGDLLRELRRDYDHVLLDSPPVNTVADARIIGPAADEALLVVRTGKTTRDEVGSAMRLLEAVSIKLAGVVLTRQKSRGPVYPYSHS